MHPGLVVKLHPAGPWRSGPDSGARNRVDPIYHSDSVYAAVTAALSTLGRREEWLDATARNPEGPAVRFSSCFPFAGNLDFIVPPRSLWPPGGGAPVSAGKVRWRSARFIPLPLVAAMLGGKPLDEEGWDRRRRERVSVAGGAAGTLSHRLALERGGRPYDWYGGAAFDRVSGVPARCGIVGDRFVCG